MMKDILEIAHKLNDTYKDDTPFLVRKGRELFVIGNATKTAVKTHDYILDFESESGEVSQEKFCDKGINPGRNFTIIETIFKLFIIFYNVSENGEITPRADDELLQIVETETEAVYTFIRNVVGAMLDVEPAILENALPSSLIRVLSKIIDNHPEIFNEADIYFRLAYSKNQKEEAVDKEETYFAQLDIYSHMALYVGKTLKMRPNDILDYWGVAELIVTFGTYRNEESYQNYLEWKALDMETKKKVKRPEPFAVKFYTNEDLNEEMEVK